jgi:hypothetical protein
MGDIGKSLGMGGNPAAQTAQPLPDIYGDSANFMSTLFGGQPQTQAQTPAMPQSQPQDGGNINIDGWQPHKRTTLGTIADVLLSALSGHVATPFAEMKRNQNMQEAMEGFTQDPENTIRRIARFNPKMALELQEKYTDNTRQQGTLDRQNNVFDMQKEQLVYNRVAGMMGGANEGTWDKMRQMALAVGQQYGVDVSPYVPKKYDPDSINYMRNGAIKPLDQEKLAETHDYHGATITTRQRGQDIRHGDAIRGQDLSHGDRVTAEAGRNARHTGPAGKPTPRSLMTKYGPGIISKDGTKMMVSRGGKQYGYVHTGKTADGQDNWTPVGEIDVK